MGGFPVPGHVLAHAEDPALEASEEYQLLEMNLARAGA